MSYTIPLIFYRTPDEYIDYLPIVNGQITVGTSGSTASMYIDTEDDRLPIFAKGALKPDEHTIIYDPNDDRNETIKVNEEAIATHDDLYELLSDVDEASLAIPFIQDFSQQEIDDLLDQIDFSLYGSYYKKVKVGSTEISAYGEDTLELIAGSGVTLTPDAVNKTVTIASDPVPQEMTAYELTTIWNDVFS